MTESSGIVDEKNLFVEKFETDLNVASSSELIITPSISNSQVLSSHNLQLKNDIGAFVEKKHLLDDHTKYKLIKDPWIPSENYAFPFSCHNKKGKIEKRYFQKHYLNDNEWLVFSDVAKGCFCKYCFLFASDTGDSKSNNSPINS